VIIFFAPTLFCRKDTVHSAEITRTAALEAARLHAMEHVLTRVSSKIARDIERGLELRF
jgi:hypothetical protein